MFNVAVINLKDIIKYLVSLTTVILIVMGVTRFFYDTKNNQKIKDQLNIMQAKIDKIYDVIIKDGGKNNGTYWYRIRFDGKLRGDE